ncbi:MAG: Glycine/sarcosine/betaine reductase complex component C subunit alpha [candidate division WS2 bacterium]|nr:Glycine/sarcosine/betaine reductase complex component C subunit alpha [Candidatus Lithacetigena glycinireducens]MBT9174631.1 Glycine/sarcosine/betaine reductase complex component C subunit alpha [Candidatus Lithacetigena glycinireducens]
MDTKDLKKIITEEFKQVIDKIKRDMISKTCIGLTLEGNEHGPKELIKGAEEAGRDNPMLEVVLIGSQNYGSQLSFYKTGESLKECHKEMELLLDEGEIDGAVTLHYDFPIGVTTVGRAITPGRGREIYISSTTGTSAINRVEAMILNVIYGVAIAKSHGIEKPTVGVLNIEGGRVVEKAINDLNRAGYPIQSGISLRSDGGMVLRGNDLLAGGVEVVVCDSLTGNILVKIFSAFHTGGDYEGVGYGYGPATGKEYKRKVAIISRASGAPVVKGAILDMFRCLRGDYVKKVEEELLKAEKAGLREIIGRYTTKLAEKKVEPVKLVVKPIPVDEEIPGIDVLMIDDAVDILLNEGVYAEACMGCTGPAVRVSKEDKEKALRLLKEKGMI